MEYVHLRQNLLVTCKTLVHIERKYMLGVFGIVENYSFDCDTVRGLDICTQLWYKDISASLREVIVHDDLLRGCIIGRGQSAVSSREINIHHRDVIDVCV